MSIVCRVAAGSGSKARWLGKLSDKCIYHWNKEINTMKLNFVLNSKSIIPQDWTIICWHDKAGTGISDESKDSLL